MQAAADGSLAMVQGIFQHGQLIACHANLRVLEGAGGGAAIKESIEHASIRSDLNRLGQALGWHGALSADVILTSGGPLYIDVNLRLVEPMNAHLSGVELVDALIGVALGHDVTPQPAGKVGVRTHQGLLALLGAARSGRRRDVLAVMSDLAGHRGQFALSTEELTPAAADWAAAIPMTVIGATVLSYQPAWRFFSSGAVSRYSLTSDGWRSLISAAAEEDATSPQAKS